MNSNFMKHGQHHQQQHLNTENNHFYFSQQSHQQFQPHYNLHQPVSYPGSYNIQPRSFPDPRYQTSDLHSYNQELYHNGNTQLPPQTYYQHPLPDTYYSRYPVFEQQNGSERKFGTPSQVSAAASFFARNRNPGLRVNARLDSLSPSVDKQHGTFGSDESKEEFGTNFRAIVSRAAPSLPQSLVRRIESGEGSGVGKVRVILRVASRGQDVDHESESFRVDKRKKQVTLFNPGCIGKTEIDIEDRQIGVAAPKMFAFDEVFSGEDSQEEVSSAGLGEVLAAVLNGNDGCLFCYGHSRLGKSWTMIGDDMSAANIGTIPLAVSWLYKGIKEKRTASGARFSVRVSAMEIRGQREEVTDLLERYSLDPEQSKEAQRGGPGFLSSLSELRASSAERAAYYLDAALHERSKDPGTGRESHFIFSLYVYQYTLDKSGKGGVVGGRSRLHLIDFGDCDRARVTGGGITMAGLGNVILGIFNGQKHLPCRDSRVTSVLRECLGGVTCHAAMMAHVSSDPCHYSETLHTVQLASRVHRMRRKRDRVKTRASVTSSGGSEDRVARLRSGGSSSEVTTTTDPSSSEMSCDTVVYRPNSDGSGTDGESPGPALSRGSSQESIISRSSGGRRRRRVLTNGALTPVRRRSASPLCLPSIDEGLERMPLHGRVPVHRQRVESPAQSEANKINNNNNPIGNTSLKADMVSKWLVGQSYQHLDWPVDDNGPLFLTKFKTEENEDVEETVACLPAREKRKPPRPPVRKTPPRIKEEVTISESLEPLQDPSQSSLEPVTVSQTDNCPASLTKATNCQVQISNSSPGFAPLDTEAAIGDHPLRILSEENLTVVSTFVADVNDLGDIDDNDDEIDPSQFSFFTVPDFYKDSSDENPCNRYFESSLKTFENTNDNIYRSKETTASENQIQHSDFVTKIDDTSPTLSDPRYLFANYKEMSSFCSNSQPQASPGLTETVSAETQFLMLSQSLRQTQETEKLDTSLNDSPSSLENIDSTILDNYDAMNFNNQNDVSRDLNKNVTKTKENEITFASKLMKFFKINRSKKKRSKSYDKELDRGLDETSRSSSLSPLDGLSRTEKSDKMPHVDICVTPVSCLSLDQTEWEYQGQNEGSGGEVRPGKPGGGGGDRKSSGYDSLEGEESSSLESSHDIFENFLIFSPPGKMDVANGNVGTVKYAVPRDNSDLNYDNISNYDEISALRKDIRRSSNTRTKF